MTDREKYERALWRQQQAAMLEKSRRDAVAAIVRRNATPERQSAKVIPLKAAREQREAMKGAGHHNGFERQTHDRPR